VVLLSFFSFWHTVGCPFVIQLPRFGPFGFVRFTSSSVDKFFVISFLFLLEATLLSITLSLHNFAPSKSVDILLHSYPMGTHIVDFHSNIPTCVPIKKNTIVAYGTRIIHRGWRTARNSRPPRKLENNSGLPRCSSVRKNARNRASSGLLSSSKFKGSNDPIMNRSVLFEPPDAAKFSPRWTKCSGFPGQDDSDFSGLGIGEDVPVVQVTMREAEVGWISGGPEYSGVGV
jgi:hypothetical protein